MNKPLVSRHKRPTPRMSWRVEKTGAMIEHLESRQLLSAVTVGIYPGLSFASETDGSGTGRGSFIVKRSGGSVAAPLTLQYYVRNNSTATEGIDFQTLPHSVTIKAGKRTAGVHILSIDDSIDEPTETVVLILKPAIYPIVRRTSALTIADNDEPDPGPQSLPGWWDTDWHYRTSVSVSSGSKARSDRPIERAINFTEVLSDAGGGGSLIVNSIRIVETTSNGLTVLDANVPVQFDADDDFNAASNASGNLIFILKGNTDANTTRYFHVYFDTAGSFSAPSFTSKVQTSENETDEGFGSVKIETETATYFYQKQEGGFSSILDKDGNDWVSWNSGPAGSGEFRGIPNSGPAGFHPGNDHDVNTQIIHQGPLKTTLESTDGSGNKMRWEFFPTFARATVISMNQNYYFLYEGTPGGSINGNDTVVTSEGTSRGLNEEWADTNGIGSENGEEWVYFRDSGVNKFFYVVHNEADDIEDSYWTFGSDMTVFGFGRHTSMPDHSITNQLLPGGGDLNDVYTIGLADGGSDFSDASVLINGVYRDIDATLGASVKNAV